MFTYCLQKDTIRVLPCDFGKSPSTAIKEEIQRRYTNKVLPGVGLVISLLDLVECSEGSVLYGDGCLYYKSLFRLIVFRPFVGEAFVAKVKGSTPEGITLTLGFFDDIEVPAKYLPVGCAFDPHRQLFFWYPTYLELLPPNSEPLEALAFLLASPEVDRLYIEKRDWVRVRTEKEVWSDTGPLNGKLVVEAEVGMTVGKPKGKSPFAIETSMSDDGLGCLYWWEEGEPEVEQEEGMEE